MRTSNQLREVDLGVVPEAETERVVAVGLGPRSVSAVEFVDETPVLPYFLPRSVVLRLKGDGKDGFLATGFFDDGGATVDWTQPVTITVGGYQAQFTVVPNSKGTVYTTCGARSGPTCSARARGASG
jgi:hypothetical protein